MVEEKVSNGSRTVLWYLVFVGFAVNYMIRINMNITIVDMVKKVQSNRSAILAQCFNSAMDIDNNISDYLENEQQPGRAINETARNEFTQVMTTTISLDRSFLEDHQQRDVLDQQQLLIDAAEDAGFAWNEYQQGLVLGSFFWLHWVTQVPGGMLARVYGTKLVFGLSNLVGSWLCVLMPLFAYWDYRMLIVLRVIQGVVCGLSWPAMHNMTAKWIPPNERSNFVTAYLGSSVGVAVTFPLFGYIMSVTSWEWVFHVCGILGTCWFIFWQFCIFDTPAQHPRIKLCEREYIERSLGTSVQNETSADSTPWLLIMRSRGLWMNVVAQWGGIWGLFTLMTQAPTYFKHIHGWNIQMTGILSGLPHMMRMIFAYVFSMFGDYLLTNEKMSRTNVRKLATTFCCIVKGIFVLALAYSGCNSVGAVLFLTLATGVHGAVSTGPLASIVDISPNFAGILLGISGMVGVLPGFISPIIVGILTLENQTVEQWKYVFQICSGMLIGSGILYVLFGDSTLQPWNTAVNQKNEQLDPLTFKSLLDGQIKATHSDEIKELTVLKTENILSNK